MSVAIIINPIAGRSRRPSRVRDRVELARRVALDCGERAEVFVTERAGQARELARAARESGVRLVVACGGDGTVNEVASALVFGNVALAVVPDGSGNGFAHALGVAGDPADALRAGIRAAPRQIDAGEIGNRLFVNVAGIGFDAHVAARFNAADGGGRGLIRYVWLTACGLATYRPGEYDIATPGWRRSVQALFVLVANGTEFGSRIRIAPRASVDDGALDLVVVEERSRFVTLWSMRRLLNRSIDRAPIWSSRPIAEAIIQSERPMAFHVDGEPVQGGTRLEARIHPRALRICC